MKLTSPLPQILPKECKKAAKIFQSFVEEGRGLDGVIPRHVLQKAAGFVILSVVKAGFLLSARAGSGLVIARLDDDTWSAPSAICTAGMGFGGQAGAEVTDFLFVLNSKSAVRSFMTAASVTLGGSLSVALGPIGRTGEAGGALSTGGQVAAIYSYSKTAGLFGGVSIEGSVIMERQDANRIAYESNVTAQMLLSGMMPVPQWADPLIQTIEAFTGQGGGRRWVNDRTPDATPGYAFGGMGSPGSVVKKKRSTPRSEFPPKSWGSPKNEGSYFDSWDNEPNEVATNGKETNLIDVSTPSPGGSRGRLGSMSSPFDTTNADIRLSADRITSPFDLSAIKSPKGTGPPVRPKSQRTESETSLKMKARAAQLSSQLENDFAAFTKFAFPRSNSTQPPNQQTLVQYDDAPPERNSPPRTDPNLPFHLQEVHVDLDKTNVALPSSPPLIKPAVLRKTSHAYDSDSDEEEAVPKHKRAPSQRFKAALKEPLVPEGVGKAIVRFDFDAVEHDDLTMRKGDIVTILERSANVDDWWKGKIDNRIGNFPANFVETVQAGSDRSVDPFA